MLIRAGEIRIWLLPITIVVSVVAASAGAQTTDAFKQAVDRALQFYKGGRYNEALKELQTARAIKDSPYLHLPLGQTYIKLKRPAEATRHCTAFLSKVTSPAADKIQDAKQCLTDAWLMRTAPESPGTSKVTSKIPKQQSRRPKKFEITQPAAQPSSEKDRGIGDPSSTRPSDELTTQSGSARRDDSSIAPSAAPTTIQCPAKHDPYPDSLLKEMVCVRGPTFSRYPAGDDEQCAGRAQTPHGYLCMLGSMYLARHKDLTREQLDGLRSRYRKWSIDVCRQKANICLEKGEILDQQIMFCCPPSSSDAHAP